MKNQTLSNTFAGALATVLMTTAGAWAAEASNTVKVFILAGQSVFPARSLPHIR